MVSLTRQTQPTTNTRDTKMETKMKMKTKQTVRVMGIECTVGTKKHAKLVADAKHYDDLARSENGMGRAN